MKAWVTLSTLLCLFRVVSALPSSDPNSQIVLGDAGLNNQNKHNDGIEYEQFSTSAFRDYQLRINEPTLCDSSVKQYSGYLDITSGKHLFFWFFESRESPEDVPLTLWLNGGPGCSSTTGLLWELGPCRIAEGGNGTTFHEQSWTSHSNVLFLDQPVEVGFSYADHGLPTTITTAAEAARDVYPFLQLFLSRFPKYAHAPFHIAGESWGGHYIPNIASLIHQKNKELVISPSPYLKRINLASLLIGNGLTDPYRQFAPIPDYLCNGPYALFDPTGTECASMRSKVPQCQRLLKACYNYKNAFVCMPAETYCWTLLNDVVNAGKNLYDVREDCDREKDGNLCYKEVAWMERWMNEPEVKIALGVDPKRDFKACNYNVNFAFRARGAGAYDSASLLPELIDEGVRLLVYAGNADVMCNYMGVEQFVLGLQTSFTDEFTHAKLRPWNVSSVSSLRQAGEVRSAGGGGSTAGNVTFVNIYEAGHMAPYNQPDAALDMFTKWIRNKPITN